MAEALLPEGVLCAGLYELTAVQRGLLDRLAGRCRVVAMVVRFSGKAASAGYAGIGGGGGGKEDGKAVEGGGGVLSAKAKGAFLSVSSHGHAEEELSAAVERLWRWCEESGGSLKLEECGLLYRSAGLYGRLARSVVSRYGLPAVFANPPSLQESPAGVVCGVCLRLAEEALLSDALLLWQIRGDEEVDTQVRWRWAAGQVGLVGGADWSRLEVVGGRVAEAEEGEEEQAGRQARLATGVAGLAGWRDAVLSGLQAWWAGAVGVGGLVSILRGQIAGLAGAEAVDQVLGEVERVDAGLPAEQVGWLLGQGLAGVRWTGWMGPDRGGGGAGGAGRVRLGSGGLYVGDLLSSRHLRFRAVCVVGLSEGVCPAGVGMDTLLTDSRRRLLREAGCAGVGLLADRGWEEHCFFELGLGSARERVHLSYARLDETNTREQRPGVYWREAAAAAAGDGGAAGAGVAGDWQYGPSGAVVRFRKVRGGGLAPAGAAGRGLVFAAHQRVQRWLTPKLTEQDGLVLDGAGAEQRRAMLQQRLGVPAVLSPSAVESYSRCAHQFFLRSVLRARPREVEAWVTGVDALDLGDLAHRVLEQVYGRWKQAGAFPLDAARLATLEQDALAALAEQMEAFAALGYVRSGLVLGAIRERLATMVLEEIRFDAARPDGLQDCELESGFGEPGGVQIGLPGGQAIRLRGRIDRLEQRAGRLEAVDFKTGRLKGASADPAQLQDGLNVQAALYLLAKEQELLSAGQREQARHLAVRLQPLRLGADKAKAGRLEIARLDEPPGGDAGTAGTLRAELLAILDRVAAGVNDGVYPRTSDAACCQGCDYRDGCGVGRMAWMQIKISPGPAKQEGASPGSKGGGDGRAGGREAR